MGENDLVRAGKSEWLRRLTRKLGIPARSRQRTGQRSPIRDTKLRAYVELLLSLGASFLGLRYPAILNRKLARASLRLRLLLDGVKDHSLFTVDRTGLITSWNRGAQRMFGHTGSDVIGQHLSCFFTPEDIHTGAPAKLLREAEDDGRANDQSWQVRKDGTRFFAEGSLAILGKGRRREFGRQTHDVTDRRNAEEVLRQTQKMDAIGRLAGGVAHDFNNLLTVISGYSELVLSALPAEDPMRPDIQAISDAGARAASLTHQLLLFSRQTVAEPKVLNLNEVVRGAEGMLRRLIGEDIVLTTVLDPALSCVKVDPALFGQILMNLSVNARDAMPTGGNLTVETRNVDWKVDGAATPARGDTGKYVMLAATDTGAGMTHDVRAHIFEPFFTTKVVGRGTGLGLATVHGIVKQSNGHIEVHSKLNLGTTFEIYLPAAEEQDPALKAPDSTTSIGGAETILLVEDEDAVRELALHTLQSYGYKVLAAAGGKDALRISEEGRSSIDLLVTDVVMPRMNGRELAEALRPAFPKMKVLYTSGYTDDAVIRYGIVAMEVSFLQKPYTPLLLTRKIRDILDGTNSLAISMEGQNPSTHGG